MTKILYEKKESGGVERKASKLGRRKKTNKKTCVHRVVDDAKFDDQGGLSPGGGKSDGSHRTVSFGLNAHPKAREMGKKEEVSPRKRKKALQLAN